MSTAWDANRNAGIRTRVTRNKKIRTETYRRDDGSINVAATLDPSSNSTRLYVDLPDGTYLTLNGREARTVYRVLQRHYNDTFFERT